MTETVERSPLPLHVLCGCTPESPRRRVARSQPSSACHASGILEFDPCAQAPLDRPLPETLRPCDFGINRAARDASVIEPLSRTAAQELRLAAILVPRPPQSFAIR